MVSIVLHAGPVSAGAAYASLRYRNACHSRPSIVELIDPAYDFLLVRSLVT